MPTLAPELRNKLERVVIEARDEAEVGARAALKELAVHEPKFYPHMAKPSQELRNHLRTRARQLGDQQDKTGRLTIDHLVGECAYEHWHRMLFARFLEENGLLIEPQENIAISLAEAEELAKEDGVDVWVFASRCAQGMLPQIFRPDDPLLQVSYATEHMLKLEKLLSSLPQAVFTSSDAMGWVYQFWQSKKKDEVNRSEVKIGADEISAVTQLFTEPYMVEFLLHNTLGAWWAGKKLTSRDREEMDSEDELRSRVALPGVGWEYLRFVRGAEGKGGPWRPAAGTFDGWPKTAAELKVLDPCCGSGHFLVAALHNLAPMLMAEEGLSACEAVDTVLRDILHGLEIDERCCQIAAFALAFAAWTYPGASGYRPLPELQIACTGIGPQSSEEQWVKLAEESGIPIPSDEREKIRNGLLNLHQLFAQAPTLGSLINPAELPADLFAAGYETIQPYLAAILSAEKSDDETRQRAITAAGMVKAADLLAGEYTLVITNVPYLSRGKQSDILRTFCERNYTRSKGDLATSFIDRLTQFCGQSSSLAAVVPQAWRFQPSYETLRQHLLKVFTWQVAAPLGTGAFEGISGEIVNVLLLELSAMPPKPREAVSVVDAMPTTSPSQKALALRGNVVESVSQLAQLENPEARITLTQPHGKELLSLYAVSVEGLSTGDLDRYIFYAWEVASVDSTWSLFHRSPDGIRNYSGMRAVLRWEGGAGELTTSPGARVQGQAAWGNRGVLINSMHDLHASMYDGHMHDKITVAIIPKSKQHLDAICGFCTSSEYVAAVRQANPALQPGTGTLVKVPFDLAHWQKVAAEKYPNGFPEPESDDPTQWLFHGWPGDSTAPFQVAVARLMGYRWPAELDGKMRLSKRARALVKRCEELAKFADDDGIVCISSIRGEEPAAERLLTLLDACGIEPAKVRELSSGADLDDWLRNDFFEEHCKLFHDRPFVWHIWDGRKRDGFHALVNYHKLCEGQGKGRKLLESLTYSYLGEWITRQKDGVKRGEGGAEDRLAAALELQIRLVAILEGEPPFDIFVRWKPLQGQPIGWEPDINDGVRINIRPFLASDLPNGRTGAGLLRSKPKIKWEKDRGKEPERPKAEYPWFWNWDEKTEDFIGTGKKPDGNRHNDCHYTNKAKQAARDTAKGVKRA
jgi:hypothetical protein